MQRKWLDLDDLLFVYGSFNRRNHFHIGTRSFIRLRTIYMYRWQKKEMNFSPTTLYFLLAIYNKPQKADWITADYDRRMVYLYRLCLIINNFLIRADNFIYLEKQYTTANLDQPIFY